jgi:outer membrane protein OmpA-like peptidoglycan-associated protein
MKYPRIITIMGLSSVIWLSACSFPKIASTDAVISVGGGGSQRSDMVVAPRLLTATNPPLLRLQSVENNAPIFEARSPKTALIPEVQTTVLFASDSYKLSSQAIQQINDFVAKVSNTGGQILLSGHTDSQHTAEYNLRLSENRVFAVRDQLLAQGIDRKRINISAFGDVSPIAPNTSSSGRQQNRRVEIKILQPDNPIAKWAN